MQNELGCGHGHIRVRYLGIVHGNAALLDKSARLALGFCNSRKHHGVHDRLRPLDLFRQKLRLAAAKRRLGLRLRKRRLFLAVHLFGQLVRKHFFRFIDTLVLVRAKLLNLGNGQKRKQ